MEENKTINIDGKEYNFDELSDNAKASIGQISVLDQDINKSLLALERLKVARLGFVNILNKELNPSDTEK